MLYCVLSCLYSINSVFNKPWCCALYLPQLSMLEIRCVLPCLCLKQLPFLAVQSDLVCVYLKLITYQRFVCCAACANRLNSILHIPFFYVVFVSSNFYPPHALCCAVRESQVTYLLSLCCAVRETKVTYLLSLCCAVRETKVTYLLSLCCTVRESHVTILNFTLSSAVCATHVTSILNFKYCRVCISRDFYPQLYLK